MSYSLKNKVLVLFAITLSFGVYAYGVKAQEIQDADMIPPAVAEPIMEEQGEPAAPEVVNDDPFGLDDTTEENGAAPDMSQNFEHDERMPDMRDRGMESQENFGMNQPNDAFPSPEGMPDVSLDDMESGFSPDSGFSDVAIDGSAPKSTFERFGNAILSRVDNDLFNQMSEIEKQTTLLNLELKREEVKNRIEALKAQRERARQEELNLEAEREKKARDEELARQKALLQEQMKLKEKEKEVEKIRQAKILNEYMNEALITNQQWVEANGKLIAEVKKLQEERKKLIDEIGAKLEGINRRTVLTLQNAEETKTAFERRVSAFNKQIEGLKQVIVEKESALLSAAEEVREANPFANGDVIDENAVDMSKEYAIMDITGKGDNIVAKIVSQDGTTFMVRKGSVLKGGETVVKITDKVITFDNHGAKSYLYTGGMVVQYEPTESFNDATKTPTVAMGVSNTSQPIRNVRGAGNSNSSSISSSTSTSTPASAITPHSPITGSKSISTTVNGGSNSSSTQSSAPKSNKGVASFSQGMMVK